MADDEAQGQEDTAWWAFDASADAALPSASFDEPLLWPESAIWEAPGTAQPAVAGQHPSDLDGGTLFPPASDDTAVAAAPLPDLDVEWKATEHDDDVTVLHSGPLAGLGGGADTVAPVSSGASMQPLADSIWAETPRADGDIGLISTSAHPVPAFYPAAEGAADRPSWRRFDLRQGNAAMIGLISLVSLVLLGMFLSVRARNDVPTDTSQSRRPSNEIAVTGPLNTVPLTPTVTTPPPVPAINIADLLPATQAGAAEAGTGTSAGASGSGASGGGAGASASTAPASSAAPSRGSGGSAGGGGGSSAPATQPSASAPSPTQPPATSAPAVEDTTPPPTSPPVDTTQPRRTPTTFTPPTIPSVSIPSYTSPSITIPGWFNKDD